MGVLHPSTVYIAWLDALTRSHIPHTRVRQGDVIRAGRDAVLQILAPPRMLYPDRGGTTASNDLIVRLTLAGLRVLLLGHADAYALDALASSGEDLSADVVEVALPPNEGINLDEPLGAVLRLAHPQLVIVQQAPKPVGKRGASALSGSVWPPEGPSAQALGTTILRVAEAGTITLRQDAQGQWEQ
jgi:hypothetical protein